MLRGSDLGDGSVEWCLDLGLCRLYCSEEWRSVVFTIVYFNPSYTAVVWFCAGFLARSLATRLLEALNGFRTGWVGFGSCVECCLDLGYAGYIVVF